MGTRRTSAIERLMLENATLKARVKELERAESDLARWTAPHDDAELEEMRKQSNGSYSLSAQQAYISALEWRVKHLETDLAKLREAINEIMDSTLPYLATKKLEKVLKEVSILPAASPIPSMPGCPPK